MTIEEMHYDFKKKLNKVDSQQNKNFLIPEIDWVLNEALEIEIENNISSIYTSQNSQNNIDNIKALIVNSQCLTVSNNIATLPTDYNHFIQGDVYLDKNECKKIKAKFYLRNQNIDFENSSFDKSSFEWRTVNGIMFQNGIKLFTDNTFTIDSFCISYVKKHPYIHNAKNFKAGSYKLPDNTILTNKFDCLLHESRHRAIVDLAVLITSGEIQAQDYQLKMQKVNLNNPK